MLRELYNHLGKFRNHSWAQDFPFPSYLVYVRKTENQISRLLPEPMNFSLIRCLGFERGVLIQNIVKFRIFVRNLVSLQVNVLIHLIRECLCTVGQVGWLAGERDSEMPRLALCLMDSAVINYSAQPTNYRPIGQRTSWNYHTNSCPPSAAEPVTSKQISSSLHSTHTVCFIQNVSHSPNHRTMKILKK